MIHKQYFEQEHYEEEYYEQTDYRSDYERRWWDYTYYEDSRFL
jgi:hypothetical protein